MRNEIKRATGLLVIEVVNSNANGDPDRESDPRQRASGCGEISPVSFKRKLRDLLEDHDTPFFEALPEKFSGHAEHYCILEDRNIKQSQLTEERGKDPAKYLDSAFVRKYWDGRVFGNTILEEKSDKDFVKTGVVQFGMGMSLAPVDIIRQTNSKKAPRSGGQDRRHGAAGLSHCGARRVLHALLRQSQLCPKERLHGG